MVPTANIFPLDLNNSSCVIKLTFVENDVRSWFLSTTTVRGEEHAVA
jgi:hypothetical protein